MPLPLVLSSLLLMKACLFGEKPLILTLLAQAVTDTQHIRWTDLGLDPVLLSIRGHAILRSEEHTSELQSLMRISYAVFCLKKKKIDDTYNDLSTKYIQTNRHNIYR